MAAPKEFQKTKPAALKRFGESGYRINASVSEATDLMAFIVSNMQRSTRRNGPMTKPLSPAAAAIREAFNLDPPGVLADYGDSLAAAIRALADQAGSAKHWHVDQLRAIAAELEGGATGTTSQEAPGLSPREVEAQEAFTEMRDEILNLSDGLEVNQVLCIIDNHTPEWV
jgi:hypothetical protein